MMKASFQILVRTTQAHFNIVCCVWVWSPKLLRQWHDWNIAKFIGKFKSENLCQLVTNTLIEQKHLNNRHICWKPLKTMKRNNLFHINCNYHYTNTLYSLLVTSTVSQYTTRKNKMKSQNTKQASRNYNQCMWLSIPLLFRTCRRINHVQYSFNPMVIFCISSVIAFSLQ